MVLKAILTSAFLIVYLTGFGQRQILTNQAEISVITVGPGSELYNSFGHSAFRIKDLGRKLDIVFNYGGFNFEEPNFYLKFASSKLLYKLFAYDYKYLLLEYEKENRWVKAQILDLDSASTQQVYDFLINNAKPENCYYKYDFFYNNCATKIPEVIKQVLGNKVTFRDNHIKKIQSHRQLLQKYLSNHKWGNFGIDIALGTVVDKEMKPNEYMFLPDFVFQGFQNATISTDGIENNIVKRTNVILLQDIKESDSSQLTPLLVFSIISTLLLLLTYKDYRSQTRSSWLDFLLFVITGSLGVVLLLLWFVTDHTVTANNLNVLWAFAPNLLVSLFVLKGNPPKWVKGYMMMLVFLILVVLITWFTKIQIFPKPIIPVLILMLSRYLLFINQSFN